MQMYAFLCQGIFHHKGTFCHYALSDLEHPKCRNNRDRKGREEWISFSLLFPLFRQSALELCLAMLKCIL